MVYLGDRRMADDHNDPQRRPGAAQYAERDRLEADNYAGFPVRRAPPPNGQPSDAPLRTMALPLDGDKLPKSPWTDIERPLLPELEADPFDPRNPAAGACATAGGFDSNRRLTVLSDPTVRTPDPKAPAGPERDEVRALVKARLEQRDKRRSSRSRTRQHAVSGGGYVNTASTQAEQIKRGKGLFARYRRESGLKIREEDVDPRDFVVWLLSLKPGLAPSSWRTYRGAALVWQQTVPHAGLATALAMLEADIGVGADAGRARPHGRQGGRWPSDVAKRFAFADFDAVVRNGGKFLRSEARFWLSDWMVAGVHTGLRTSEWAATSLETIIDPDRPHGRRALLYVLYTNPNVEGANAIQRTLDISNFSEEVYETVRRHVERASEWSRSHKFDMRHSQCAQLLYEICGSLFSLQCQLYTLDSLRHQFVANMKTIYNPPEVAALVGHIGSENVEAEHYGKRRAAWPDDKITEIPVPIKEQVEMMERQWNLYEEHREVKNLRKASNERRREAAVARKKAKRAMAKR
jgi:hypothetical protein